MGSNPQFDRHEDHVMVPPIRKLAFGMGDVGRRLMNDTFNNNHLVLYNMILGYGAPMIGLALSIARVLDAFTDPLMGQISDNTRTRWGRRRPYVLFGGSAAAVLIAVAWLIPGGLPSGVFFALFMGAFLLFSLANKAAFIPYGALGMEISIDYHERTSVQAYRTFVGVGIAGTLTAAVMFLATLPIFPNTGAGLRTVGIGFGLSAILCFWLTFKGTREEAEIQSQPKVPWLKAFAATLSNRPFLILLGAMMTIIFGIFTIIPLAAYLSIYFVFGGDMKGHGLVSMYGGWLTNGITVLLLPLFLRLAVRYGKKRIFVICTFLVGLSFVSTWFIYTPRYPYLMLVFSGLLALPLNGVNLMPGAMIADVCDLDELRTGCRREGAFQGVYSLLLKLIMVPVPFITGLIIGWSGFVPGAPEQAPEALFRLRMVFAFVPLIFICFGALLAAFYPLTETRVREVRALLEERRREHKRQRGSTDSAGPHSPGTAFTPEPAQ